MTAIYEPQGAAREYSPLALNYVRGCDHGCVYCYVPKMMKRFDAGYVHSDVYMKEVGALKGNPRVLPKVQELAQAGIHVIHDRSVLALQQRDEVHQVGTGATT